MRITAEIETTKGSLNSGLFLCLNNTQIKTHQSFLKGGILLIDNIQPLFKKQYILLIIADNLSFSYRSSNTPLSV